MIVTNDERYDFEKVSRIPNSAYEYETTVDITFKGRPANQVEKKNYRIQAGAHSSTDSTYIFSSNLPSEIKIGDKIRYLGKIWVVESVGYYLEQAIIINPSIFNEKYIADRCPKGITLR